MGMCTVALRVTSATPRVAAADRVPFSNRRKLRNPAHSCREQIFHHWADAPSFERDLVLETCQALAVDLAKFVLPLVLIQRIESASELRNA